MLVLTLCQTIEDPEEYRQRLSLGLRWCLFLGAWPIAFLRFRHLYPCWFLHVHDLLLAEIRNVRFYIPIELGHYALSQALREACMKEEQELAGMPIMLKVLQLCQKQLKLSIRLRQL